MRKPELCRSFVRDVYDHEVYFSFDADQDAIHFQEWWESVGYEKFRQWVQDNEDQNNG